jgi:hypothetical protein
VQFGIRRSHSAAVLTWERIANTHPTISIRIISTGTTGGLSSCLCTKDVLTTDAVYEEKSIHRRIQGRDNIIETWQGWAQAFPDSKATFVREIASGDSASLSSSGRVFTVDRCKHPLARFRQQTSRLKCQRAWSVRSKVES